jgi:hypothetical protein
MEAIETIKNFCTYLSGSNIQEILVEYDGSGDSGDCMFYVTLRVPPETGPTSAADTRKYQSFRQEVERLGEQNALLTNEKIDEFEDAVYGLLPMGWEINDGSFGEIKINVDKRTVAIEHNERYTSIDTSNYEY